MSFIKGPIVNAYLYPQLSQQLPQSVLNQSIAFNFLAKRIFDIFISSLALLAFAPLFLIISIIIKIETRGPVLIRRECISRFGKKFHLLKFHTLLQSSTLYASPMLCQTDDRRVSKIGRFLRRFRLDDMPQLLNVLSGSMSLIGNRPERPIFEISHKEMTRIEIKPGIIQIQQENSMIVGKSGVEEFEKLEIQYISSWSLIKDLFLLTRPVWQKSLKAKNFLSRVVKF